MKQYKTFLSFYVTLFVIALGVSSCVSTCYSEETESQKLYRIEVENEIKRHHELQMAKAQIEILARLEMLGASRINVSNGSYSSSQSKNKINNTFKNNSTQKNTNK